MSVRERFVQRERMQEHHNRMRWKTLEEGIQQLKEVAVLEVLFVGADSMTMTLTRSGAQSRCCGIWQT